MADRPRHPDKDFEALLREVEDHGWRVTKGKKYFKCYCPCPDKHMRSVVLTPSKSRTLMNTRKWFYRRPCWEDET